MASAPVLSKVTGIRRLPLDLAAQQLPVHLVGVVTAVPGLKKAFFIEDETGGISVDRTDETEVQVGDRVDVKGYTSPGLFAPSLLSTQVRILGHSAQPRAAPMDYTHLIGGIQDSKRIELTGVVHTAHMGKVFDHDVLLASLDIGGTTVKLIMQDFEEFDYAHLIDATVRVRGVCTTEFNDKRQFIGSGLFVPTRADVEIISPPRADPFAGPSRSMRQALQFGQAVHRIKVSGTVTWQDPGHALYLQDGQDGIRVQTDMEDVLELGTRVEAVGFPSTGEYSPVLRWAVVRTIGLHALVEPVRADAADVIYQDNYFNKTKYDGELIQIAGKVIESRFRGNWNRIIVLSEHNQLFEAFLQNASGAKRYLDPGSVVSLTGVCSIRGDVDRNPVSFEVLLRSPEDIVILKQAPWWSPKHAVWVLAVLAGVMAVIVLWVVILKNRVERQTRTIKESEERFRDLAERDPLTGLPNRLMLEEHMTASLARCAETRHRAAVFTVDIDRFKQVNDTYGHLMGDECLKAVASRLRNAAPETDTIARTGGEEFTLVAGGLTGQEDADRIANKLLDIFHDPLMLSGLELAVTVSVGGALYPDDGLEPQELRKRSDQALYEAKRTGRNKAVFATRELSNRLEHATNIETAVRESLRIGSFWLAYQPVYDAAGVIRHMEALLRTSDALLSSLGPSVYVPIAESLGLVLPMGRWVLQAVCRNIVAWRAEGLDVCPISINLTSSQLLQSGFSVDVLDILDSFNLDPSSIAFELTETATMSDFKAVLERLCRLAQTGIAFTIDDFGNGYSSLSRIHQLPVKSLKIDRSFIQNLDRDGGTHTVVETAIRMAQGLKLTAVAKGIESHEQFDLLRELGCDLFQGYLLAQPMPAKEIASLLRRQNASMLTFVS